MDKSTEPTAPLRLQGMLVRHPWELTMMGSWVILGTCLAVAGFHPDFDPSPSLAEMPGWLHAVIGIPMTVSGAMVLWAMLAGWDDLAARWRLERAGLKIGAAAWIAYAAVVGWWRVESTFPYGTAITIAAAALWRVRASRIEERTIRRVRGH